MRNNKMRFSDSLEIYNLFKNKNWQIVEDNKHSLFNRFVNLFNSLNDDKQRKLLIKLASEYKTIRLEQYKEKMITILKQIIKNEFSQSRAINIMPIKLQEDQYTVKSSDFVSYLINLIDFKYEDELGSKNYHIIGSFSELKKNKNKFQSKDIIIIDDFIGSGEYASGVIKEINDLGINNKNIIITSLFITQRAINVLSSLTPKIKLYYGEIAESLLNSIDESEKETLLEIEKLLNIDGKFSLGYGQCGCGITLIRTPNNTLPLFWVDDKNKTRAPFPRN